MNAQPSEVFFNNYHGKKNNPQGNQNIGPSELTYATLNSIPEPDLCAYEAIVCTPLLCSPKPYVEGGSKKQIDIKNSPTPFKDVMKLINNTCLMKQEDWWTYEVCFNKGVRQMHFNIDQNFAKDGSIIQTKVLASQFHLGFPILSVYENEESLSESSR